MEEHKSNKYLVNVRRTIYPFNQFRELAYYYLEQAKQYEKLRINNCLITMVFCAFSLEAFINYLGAQMVPDWIDLERKLNVNEKVNRLFETRNEKINKQEKPYCFINVIFDFRDEIVHAKDRTVTKTQIIDSSEIPTLPKVWWEKMVTLENACKFQKNTDKIINALSHDLLNDDNPIGLPEISFWNS